MVSSITNEETNNSRNYLICDSAKERKRVTKTLNIEHEPKPPRGNKKKQFREDEIKNNFKLELQTVRTFSSYIPRTAAFSRTV